MLDATAPQILKSYQADMGSGFQMRCDEPPLDDVKVRRALMIGTNIRDLRRVVKAEDLPFFWAPYSPADLTVFTPLEEMPEDIQILYDYNPTLAKQMLAEAGYPDGFDINLTVSGTHGVTATEAVDLAALLKDQWAKIGVEATIESLDPVTYFARIYPVPPQFHGIILWGVAVADPIGIINVYYKTGAYANFGQYSNPKLDELVERMEGTLDIAEQNRLAKEAAVILLRDAVTIPTSLLPQATYWWPWVKNYYGELTIDDFNATALIRYMWIDQDLKAKMGF